MSTDDTITGIIRGHYPDVQAVYRFGSRSDGTAHPDSDADIALLLPHAQARESLHLSFSRCRFDLEDALGQTVDLVNARTVSTVLQKEIIFGDRVMVFLDDSD